MTEAKQGTKNPRPESLYELPRGDCTAADWCCGFGPELRVSQILADLRLFFWLQTGALLFLMMTSDFKFIPSLNQTEAVIASFASR